MKAEKMASIHEHPVQIVRLELADVHAVEQVNQRRNPEEYDSLYRNHERFLLPPNVDRFLYGSEALEDLQEQARMYPIEDVHIKIIKHGLLCPTTTGMQMRFIPLHIAMSYRLMGIRITGRYFVSMLHLAATTLPAEYENAPWAADLREVRSRLAPQERQALIEYYMRIYLDAASSCTDLTIIGIPSKAVDLREESPTHRAFSRLALPCSSNNEHVISSEGSDIYVFAHSRAAHAMEHTQSFLSDPEQVVKLTGLSWSARIIEKLLAISKADWQTPEFVSLYMQQTFTVLEWIRVTWKNG